ncbi:MULTISPECIES: glycosyltransferase family 2 protein [Vibrio]|uniref:Glycosyltransferase n=1 Tax=Vibrio casei TaxID=673372 RepID=A0A368LPT5_9VIBR|nr:MULTISPECIES: glycosyltransferase family 2 protein [Vibrio]RCS73848.1 glycosyltransferase [Vibrio casei]SJN31437.1 Glycosyltransferase [Vibrio casei]HBV77250.1 glycosyltransferase [Vibrio sp.]
MKTVSIVVPCFNESEVIDTTVAELLSVTRSIENYQFEIIFVNDGSSDNTETKLLSYSQQYDNIRIISFSRNFGHQQAVSAGLDVSSGDAVVLIDADLQDPPKLIADMIVKWEDGFDVVYGTRSTRQGESKFKLASAKCFYRTLNYLSEVPIPLDTGDFRLMDRQVVDHLVAMPEKSRFIRGMVSWIGFNQTSIHYERSARFAGESKYPLVKMLKFGIDGILSFSVKPLKLSIMMGFACSGIALLMLLYSVYVRLMTEHWESGWTSILVSIFFMGGVQLISIGILGEYIARIYNESKDRPLYIIKKNRVLDAAKVDETIE